MKRVAIITTIAHSSADYSLTTVVADQLHMLTDHGYRPTLIVQENFATTDFHMPGVSLCPIMPVLPLHDYQLGERERPNFKQQVRLIEKVLRSVIYGCDVAITHDLMFLGWYLPHNEALRHLARQFSNVQWLHWVHSAPSPRPSRLTYPGILRYTLAPNSKLVYLNHHDVPKLAEMFDTTPDYVRVFYNLRDPRSFFRLHPLTVELIMTYPLLTADVVSVYPFSTPRWQGKNVERLIRLMAKIKEQGRSVFVVCVNSHCNTPEERKTVERLQVYTCEQGLDDRDLCFTSTMGPRWEYSVPNEVVRQLFQLSNVFICPSLNPPMKTFPVASTVMALPLSSIAIAIYSDSQP